MTFSQSVYNIVSKIPKGKVMTYGQIASMLGGTQKSRAVGWALRNLTVNEKDVPWWRVVNKDGYISINQGKGGIEKEIQRDLLLEDGIEIGDDLTVDMSKHLMKF